MEKKMIRWPAVCHSSVYVRIVQESTESMFEQKTRLITTLRHELLLKHIKLQELQQSQMQLVQVSYLMFVTFDNGEADVVTACCMCLCGSCTRER